MRFPLIRNYLVIALLLILSGCSFINYQRCRKVEHYPPKCNPCNYVCDAVKNPCPVVKIPGYYPTDLDCIGELKPISVLRARGVGVVILGHRIRFIIPTDTFFDRDYVDINECHVSTIAIIADVIKALPCAAICITGHTDNVGTCCEKLQKSKKLAETVAAHLWAQGIGWDRMHVIGRGDWDQIASDRSVFGSTDNRRVEIRMDFSGNCGYNNSYCPDCM